MGSANFVHDFYEITKISFCQHSLSSVFKHINHVQIFAYDHEISKLHMVRMSPVIVHFSHFFLTKKILQRSK
jgi:hypothetical protein